MTTLPVEPEGTRRRPNGPVLNGTTPQQCNGYPRTNRPGHDLQPGINVPGGRSAHQPAARGPACHNRPEHPPLGGCPSGGGPPCAPAGAVARPPAWRRWDRKWASPRDLLSADPRRTTARRLPGSRRPVPSPKCRQRNDGAASRCPVNPGEFTLVWSGSPSAPPVPEGGSGSVRLRVHSKHSRFSRCTIVRDYVRFRYRGSP